MDAVQKAGSGHPGMPMGMADAAYILWTKFLNHDPADPEWYNRDRFILSAGHGSILLYSLLHLTGYDLPIEELQNLRQLDSLTPGHPEVHLTPGVETTTGPLGQGFATGVGMAMAEAHMAAKFNKDGYPVSDHYTYGIVSDGDLMEGISQEAASLAGHLKLGKIIYLYDDNKISIDGSTDLAFTENVEQRFQANEWHTIKVDGHNREAIEEAIKKAQSVTDKPSLVICRTHIGFGSPNKQDSSASHGSALGEEEITRTKENLGWEYDEKFHIPDEVLGRFRKAKEEGAAANEGWANLCREYKKEHAELAGQFEQSLNRELPTDFESFLPEFEADEEGMATRASSGQVIQALVANIPQLTGGSADLTGSNKTWMDDAGIFSASNYAGKNIHFGVREHAMGAALNGMALHKGVIPFGGTFLIFSDYCRPAIRIAALSHIPSVFVFTHDSIGLGGDGPTHQPIEHLASLRAMPNALVLRPADANEVAWAWKAALEYADGPALLALTRQSIPTFERTDGNRASDTLKGAYVLDDAEKETPDAILIGTGSEVHLAMKAKARLKEQEGVDVRVVSMPSWELFRKQDEAYKQSILPEEVTARVSIEAAATFGWKEWVGDEGVTLGVDRFGASAPYKEIFKKYGLTVNRIVEEAQKLIS